MPETSTQPKRPTINDMIRRAREAADLNQETVARAAGLTQATYSRFELGEADIDLSVVLKIKEFLDKYPRKKARGIPLASLMGGPAARMLQETPEGSKLTEQIAKQLEQEYQFQLSLAAQRERVAREAEHEKDVQELRDYVEAIEARALKADALELEVAALKAQIQELLSKKKRSATKSRKKK